MIKRSLFAASSAAMIAASPAFAGNLEEPVVEAPIAAPVQVMPISDWTGFYLGAQAGYGRTSGINMPGATPEPEPEEPMPLSIGPSPIGAIGFGKLDGGLGGLHIGYLHDLGQFVIGGELDHDWGKLSSKVDVGDGLDAELKVDRIARAKLIAGYDLGDGLIYGTAGAFRAEMKGSGVLDGKASDNGWLAGLGYKHKFTENWIGGVEALYHKASNFDDEGFDLKLTTITARISYKF